MRREFSSKVLVAALERANGHCENPRCGYPLSIGKYAFDHVIPDAMGGKPTLENCQVLCVACHSEKTRKQDVPAIAKTRRIQYGHLGIKRPRSFGRLPGGKDSPWKKTFNHGTVRR